MAQYYAIGFDYAVPYNVYGGTQDNGCHMGPSTRRGGGNIPFEDWANVGCADGFYNEVDWKESRWLYNESQFGGISRTGPARPDRTAGIGAGRPALPAGAPYRCNWSAPILVSPHNADVVYHAAQVLLRSPFRGERWEVISPDLTVNDPAKQRWRRQRHLRARSRRLTSRRSCRACIWVGTDDGNVQVTKTAARTWTNRSRQDSGPPWLLGQPRGGVQSVARHGLRDDDRPPHDDFRPFIWKTTDFGQTWTSIAGNLPQDAINVVRESPRNANVLFAGTDTGVFVTIDGGKAWTRLKGAPLQAAGGGGRRWWRRRARGATARPRGVMPTVPVHDLKIHPRDRELIAGTHGRGIWIADISEIEEFTPAVRARRRAPLRDRSGHCLGNRPARCGGRDELLRRQPSDGHGHQLFPEERRHGRREGSCLQRIARDRRDGWREDGRREHRALEPAGPARANRGRSGGRRRWRGGRGGGGGAGGGRGAGAGADAGAAAGFANFAAPTGTYRVVLSVGGREYTQLAQIVAGPGANRFDQELFTH